MKKIILIAILSITPVTYAVNLEGTNGVEILAVDGKELKNSFFSEKESELSTGKHQIVVRYSNQFNDDELIESQPAIFTINLEQDTEISVGKMNNQHQAEKKIKAGLAWQIISQDKRYEITDSALLKGKGFMPYSDIEQLILAYNLENDVQLVDDVTNQTVIATPIAPQDMENSTLISLYQSASKSEKKAFRLWLLDQDLK